MIHEYSVFINVVLLGSGSVTNRRVFSICKIRQLSDFPVAISVQAVRVSLERQLCLSLIHLC